MEPGFLCEQFSSIIFNALSNMFSLWPGNHSSNQPCYALSNSWASGNLKGFNHCTPKQILKGTPNINTSSIAAHQVEKRSPPPSIHFTCFFGPLLDIWGLVPVVRGEIGCRISVDFYTMEHASKCNFASSSPQPLRRIIYFALNWNFAASFPGKTPCQQKKANNFEPVEPVICIWLNK